MGRSPPSSAATSRAKTPIRSPSVRAWSSGNSNSWSVRTRPRTRRVTAIALEHREVLVHLPLRELDAVVVPFLPLQLDVAVEDVRAQRRSDHLGARQLGDR